MSTLIKILLNLLNLASERVLDNDAAVGWKSCCWSVQLSAGEAAASWRAAVPALLSHRLWVCQETVSGGRIRVCQGVSGGRVRRPYQSVSGGRVRVCQEAVSGCIRRPCLGVPGGRVMVCQEAVSGCVRRPCKGVSGGRVKVCQGVSGCVRRPCKGVSGGRVKVCQEAVSGCVRRPCHGVSGGRVRVCQGVSGCVRVVSGCVRRPSQGRVWAVSEARSTRFRPVVSTQQRSAIDCAEASSEWPAGSVPRSRSLSRDW